MAAGRSGNSCTPEVISPTNPEATQTEVYAAEIQKGLDDLQQVISALNSFSKEEVIFDFDSHEKKMVKIAEKYSISLEKKEESQSQHDTAK